MVVTVLTVLCYCSNILLACISGNWTGTMGAWRERRSKDAAARAQNGQRTSHKSGPFRTIGVALSAPKTTLLRGEKTTISVVVTGLEGLKNDIPLELCDRGVRMRLQGLYVRREEVRARL